VHREADLGPSTDLDRTRDAFVALARGRLDRAYRLAGLILGGADEAEDATQDALTKAWQSFGSLRNPALFDAWLDRILVNVCRDRLRRRGRVRFVVLDDYAYDRPTADPFHRLLDGDEVLRAIDGLDADHRAVIILRFWADLTVDDIADRLGWPAGTVKSRLHRALEHVRARLPADSREPEVAR
jgi:RNA polymerase sigma-70 factor (ECF subfamily)